MSGAYIKNMKKPDMCGHCRFADAFDCSVDGTFIEDHSVVRPDCPLVFLPEHGDLIDRNVILNNKGVGTQIAGWGKMYHETVLEYAPAIIPADIETMYYPQVDGITPMVVKNEGGENEQQLL